ncbi:MAG: B12-binding domain-containing radical SAM protein [Myxococcales bacterium]|nr:B12-binding domain-containing radical SAM protein [Myxococcales bacterium]
MTSPRPRLLLINPTYGATFWGLDYAVGLAGASTTIAPLALATIAGLSPQDWDIRIADENVEPIDLDEPCDIVGITAMNVQAARAFELAAAFRKRGRLVVIGGPFATLQPERCAAHADVLVVGEAERIWPEFCADYVALKVRSRYVEEAPMDLALSPTPRYDLFRRGAYSALPIQTTRGCPFGCEFCDIIIMQGRKVRAKPIPNVLAEIDAIGRAGGRSVFVTDDNFIGSPKIAKALLAAMTAHSAKTGYAPPLFTQASVNLSEDPELLRAMVRAGFTRVFLGIESPRQSSLREAGKRQNVRGVLLDQIHTIQRAGLMVWAGMIVGFDHDDDAIFGEQADFLDAAGIAVAMIGMLNAPPRTPLYTRLAVAGRIHATADWADNCAWTNIVPMTMSRSRLFEGYADLLKHVYTRERYASRVLANIERMEPAPKTDAAGRWPALRDLGDFGRAALAYSTTLGDLSYFGPNVLRILRQNPTRMVEGTIHLSLWRHFERYVPEVTAKISQAARSERASVAPHLTTPALAA